MNTVLIVDDDVRLSTSLKTILELENMEAVEAENGGIALKMLDKIIPDIILLDIIMPDMEGIEFLRKMKEKNISTPVVIMSGNPVGIGFFRVAELLGAKDTIQKPFSGKDLIKLIKKHI